MKSYSKAKASSKLEPIEASDLAGLSDEARHVFVQRAAEVAPVFAYDLSRTLPAGKMFEHAYERSLYTSSKDSNPFLKALSAGHFALARLWSARLMSVPKALLGREKSSPGAVGDSWRSMLSAAQGSCSTDDQIWRARAWMWRAASGESLSKLSAGEIAHEAMCAFMAGRPDLGLRCARELLAFGSDELARVTASAHDWPEGLPPSLWSDSMKKRERFVNKIEKFVSDHSDYSSKSDIFNPKNCGLLSHMEYWSQATKKVNPQLSKKLSSVSSELWECGAFAGPSRHAELFVNKPYGPEDVRAIRCETSVVANSGSRSGRFYDVIGAEAAIFAAILARCCAYPDGEKGGREGTSWDAFTRAHPKAPQANPNPFTTWGESSCTLLSLAGDARLIEIGLERGYAPNPSAWVLVAPGAMSRAFLDKKLVKPTICNGYVENKRVFLPQNVTIDVTISKEELKKKPLKEGEWVRSRGRPKKSVSDEKERPQWIYQSLSSVALACGRIGVARKLEAVGCAPATLDQVSKEIPPSSQKDFSELESFWLLEATNIPKKRGTGPRRV